MRVAIANQADLDKRLAELAPGGSSASSVLSPAAALAGMVGGALLSPVGLVASVRLIAKFGKASWTTLGIAVAVLAGIAFWALLPVWPGTMLAVAGAGLPLLGLAGGIFAVVVRFRESAAVLEAASSLARLLNAATEVIGQLFGPRSQVRHPLLRELLVLGDGLAELGAQLLGAVAFVVDQVGPRVAPTVRILMSLIEVASTAGAALGALMADLRLALFRLTEGEWSIVPLLRRLAVALREVFVAVKIALGVAGWLATFTMQVGYARLSSEVGSYLTQAKEMLRRAFKEHPTVAKMTQLTDLLTKKSETPTGRPGLVKLYLSLVIPPMPALPDVDQVMKDLALEKVPPLTAEAFDKATRPQAKDLDPTRVLRYVKAYLALERIADRPSVFATQREHLRVALARNRTDLQELTSTIATLVGRFLAPATWARYAPLIAPHVDRFVALVYGDISAEPAPPRPTPVLRPDEPLPVRPQIRLLKINAPGATATEAQTLREDVVRRINARSYAVVPATWGR